MHQQSSFVTYPIIEDGNVFYFETSTRNKISVEFNDLTNIFGKNEFIIESRELVFSESESYSFLIIRKSYGNAATIIEAFDKFIKLANEPDEIQ